MYRGTTPTYTLTVPDHDLTNKSVYVTIAQRHTKLTLAGDRLAVSAYETQEETGSRIIFTLTQEETLRMTVGDATVQVRFIDAGGTAWATEIGRLTVNPVLMERVIAYELQDTP